MNLKRVTFALVLALTVSGLCTWMIARKLEDRTPAPKIPEVRYAAPSRPLQAGEVLKPDSIELVSWPSSNPLPGAFIRTSDLVGREILFPLAQGQPILDRDLSAIGSGTGLAGKIPDGMRAIALRSDEVVGVAGFLVPGSHLDVLVTYRSDRVPDPITATVLQNAVVLAAGHQVEPDPEGKPSAVAVVTLLLTPEQAQRAVLASTQGAIHFVLRNGGDMSAGKETPMLLSQLSGDLPGPAAAVPTPKMKVEGTAAQNAYAVETILGSPDPSVASLQAVSAGAKP